MFNAEYGQAQSGIVNIVTKSGSNQRFSARGSAYLASYVTSHDDVFMGADGVSPDENNLEFTLQGPVSFLPGGTFFGNVRHVSTDGWLYGERRTRIEDTVPIQAYIREAQQTASDLDNLVGIAIPDSLMTGDGSLVPLNDNSRLSVHAQVGFSPLSQLRVSYAMFLHDKDGRSYQDSRRYAPDGVPTTLDDGVNHILSLTHAPSSSLYYEFGFSYQESRVNTFLFDDPLDPRYQGSPYGANGFLFGGTSNTREFLDQETILAKFSR